MAAMRSSCRGAITLGCLAIAAVACAVSMVVCAWLFEGPQPTLVAQVQQERAALGAALNETQAQLTQARAELAVWQAQPRPVCAEPRLVSVRVAPRPLPVFAPEWSIR